MKKELILLSFMMILLSNDRLVCEVPKLDQSVHDDVESVDDELICYGEKKTDCHPFVIKGGEVKEFLEIVLDPVAVYIKKDKVMLAQAQIFLREKIGVSIKTQLDLGYHFKKDRVATPAINDKKFKAILQNAADAILIRKQRLSEGDSTKLIRSIWRSLLELVDLPFLEPLEIAREKCQYAIKYGIANPTSGSVANDRKH